MSKDSIVLVIRLCSISLRISWGADDLTYKLPEPPEKSATNRELTARANKYGVTVSELFTSENRSRTLRNRK